MKCIFYFFNILYKTIIFKEHWAEQGKTWIRLKAITNSFLNRILQWKHLRTQYVKMSSVCMWKYLTLCWLDLNELKMNYLFYVNFLCLHILIVIFFWLVYNSFCNVNIIFTLKPPISIYAYIYHISLDKPSSHIFLSYF